MSCLLHITLDNPLVNEWPIIGPEAVAFQQHHFDPSRVTRSVWTQFLSTAHAIPGFIAPVCLLVLPRTFTELKIIILHSHWMTYALMAAHRWSHLPPQQLPYLIQGLQATGLLISTQEHSLHHSTYDNNFSILTGWCNPAFNWMTTYLVNDKNIFWAYVFLWYTLLIVWVYYLSRIPMVQSFANRLQTQAQKITKYTVWPAVALCGWVVWSSAWKWGISSALFWHAVSMGVGVAFFMSQGILSFQNRSKHIKANYWH